MGVLAEATAGTGLRVTAGFLHTAIQTTGGGYLKFDRSGTVSVTGSSTTPVTKASVSVYGGLTASSFALATIRGHIPGLHIEGVSGNPADGKITIFFNKAVPAGVTVKVGWLVLR